VQLLRHGVVAHAEIPDLRRHAADHVHRELAFHVLQTQPRLENFCSTPARSPSE